MALSSPRSDGLTKTSQKLICLARSIPVRNTPEERVRQQLLRRLLGSFGCSKALIGVEVALKSLISCHWSEIPRRRLDIVCFYISHGALLPLLIIECKASYPEARAIVQLHSYNFFLRAPMLALAWPDHIVAWSKEQMCFEGQIESMPTYQELKEFLHRNHSNY